MTEAEARARIELLTKSSSYPTLSSDEIDALVAQAKRADSSGRAPSADDWEETWAIAAAVAIGWELKAAQVVADFDFESAGQKFSRSQIHKMCLEQAKHWRKRGGSTTVDVGPAGVEYDYTEVLP